MWTVRRTQRTVGSSVIDLEDGAVADARRDAHGHRHAPLDLAFAPQRSQSKTKPPVPSQTRRSWAAGTSRGSTPPTAASSAVSRISPERLAGLDGPPQVAGGGAADERPGEGLEPLAHQLLVVAPAPLGVGQRLVGRLQLLELLRRRARRRRPGGTAWRAGGRPADRGRGRVARDAEDDVEVLGLLHSPYTIGRGRSACQAETPGSARRPPGSESLDLRPPSCRAARRCASPGGSPRGRDEAVGSPGCRAPCRPWSCAG